MPEELHSGTPSKSFVSLDGADHLLNDPIDSSLCLVKLNRKVGPKGKLDMPVLLALETEQEVIASLDKGRRI